MARAGPSNETRNPSPSVLDFSTSKSTELFPDSPVVGIQEGARTFISQGCRSFG